MGSSIRSRRIYHYTALPPPVVLSMPDSFVIQHTSDNTVEARPVRQAAPQHLLLGLAHQSPRQDRVRQQGPGEWIMQLFADRQRS
jgi:hypothetical protein